MTAWKALSVRLGVACLMILLVPVLTRAAEPEPAKFYSGLQMKMIIRSSPGGSYDTYGRLLARHITRHIPGQPSLVVGVFLFTIGLNLFLMGLLAELVTRTYHESQSKPIYHVRERTNFEEQAPLS